MFREKGEAFKVELVDAIPRTRTVKIYKQGDWFDLCRGPHMPSTGKIGTAIKLMKVAGAYWRGDSNNPMLTRIYGTAWHDQAALDAYLHRLEEAEKRDHRRLGRRWTCSTSRRRGGHGVLAPQGLEPVPGSGRLYAPPLKATYDEVNAPQVLDKSLWEISGHWAGTATTCSRCSPPGDDIDDNDRVYALKPMNCPAMCKSSSTA